MALALHMEVFKQWHLGLNKSLPDLHSGQLQQHVSNSNWHHTEVDTAVTDFNIVTTFVILPLINFAKKSLILENPSEIEE